MLVLARYYIFTGLSYFFFLTMLFASSAKQARTGIYRLDKIYPHRTGKSPIVHGVGDIAPVIGKSSLDIMIHAPSRAEHSIPSPANLVVEGVRVRIWGWIFSAGDHDGGITRLQF